MLTTICESKAVSRRTTDRHSLILISREFTPIPQGTTCIYVLEVFHFLVPEETEKRFDRKKTNLFSYPLVVSSNITTHDLLLIL